MTQVYSQNGWPAFHTADEGNFVRFQAGGRGWWAANKWAAIVAKEFIDRFNTEVEPVVFPGEEYDDWSFADRLVRGSTATVSNHGSATAWDINSTRHLLGHDNTFSDADESRLMKIRNSITDDDGQPVLRWGGSYSGRKDEMHVEIIGTPAEVKQAAQKIEREKDMPLSDNDLDKVEARAKAAVLAVLKDKTLIDNTDQDGKPNGTMSIVTTLARGDFKADREDDQNTAEVKRDNDNFTDIQETLKEHDGKLAGIHTVLDEILAKLTAPPAG